MNLRLLILIPLSVLQMANAQNSIKIDQFGYLPHGTKIAVVSRPVVGFNGGSTFMAGTGKNDYQLRRKSDGKVVFTGMLTAWHLGNIDTISGDMAWWFDFTGFNVPGSYYVYDIFTKEKSHPFEIDTAVYANVEKAVEKYYYYARCGVAKKSAYAGSNWADAACHIGGNNQDAQCRLYSSPTDMATNKDLSGGWHDAGDYNKYVNFAYGAIVDILFAYKEHPLAFSDHTDIPESGNGVPDILDEVRYETDWLLKMQQENGSVLSVVGVLKYAGASPPSADAAQRLYGPATTAATFSTAAMLALASSVFNTITTMAGYADTLKKAAAKAYTWAQANPNITFSNSTYGLASGEQEPSPYDADAVRFAAAVYLYSITGNRSYQRYIDKNYIGMHPYSRYYWYQYEQSLQDALLYYANLSGAYFPTASVKSNINSRFVVSVSVKNGESLSAFIQSKNAYMAYMEPSHFTWGSNNVLAHNAIIMMDPLTYGLDVDHHPLYKKAVEGYLHYFHGVNPLDLTYISNMGAYGAENSITQFYHEWFADGTDYDQAGVSLYGPPPGIVPGGANYSYHVDDCCTDKGRICRTNVGCDTAELSPPLRQPAQKAYKDFNTGWPADSWSVTEPAIYYQAAYIRLLANFVHAAR